MMVKVVSVAAALPSQTCVLVKPMRTYINLIVSSIVSHLCASDNSDSKLYSCTGNHTQDRNPGDGCVLDQVASRDDSCDG